jgi:small subunit ribosomal protein S5
LTPEPETEKKDDEMPDQDASSSTSESSGSKPDAADQTVPSSMASKPDAKSKDGNKKDEVTGSDDETQEEDEQEEDAGGSEDIADVEERKPVKPKIPDVPVRGTEPELWIPKTKLGRLVKDGEITNISDALKMGLTLREPEIVDILLPDLEDEVLDVNMVQRMTDSGRRVKFAITTVVGNQDGYVGLGHAKGKEVGPAIRKAIDNAKINIMEIKRGCGSWECGCGKPHSLPFGVKGKSGSVEVFLKPAPRGIGLSVGNIARHVLRLAGIRDAWGSTRGSTRTTVNYSKAIIDSLRKTSEMKVTDEQIKRLQIAQGALGEMRKEGETTDDDGEMADKVSEPVTDNAKPPGKDTEPEQPQDKTPAPPVDSKTVDKVPKSESVKDNNDKNKEK